ncbi:MAG: DUF2062 domain-containing protein [Nanoarchaeota archaeon]
MKKKIDENNDVKKLIDPPKRKRGKTGYKDRLKKAWQDIFSLEASPHQIALGFTIGIFMGILPLAGIEYLIAIALMFILRVSKLALFTGLLIVNPITTPLVYYASFQLGKLIVGYEPIEEVQFFSREFFLNASKPLLVGNLIIAVSAALISYIVLRLIFTYRIKKLKEKEKKSLRKKKDRKI